MVEEKTSSNEIKPKKSRWYLWVCGGCGCFVIIIIISLFALRSFTGFNLANIFGGSKTTKSTDEEDREMTKQELIDYFVIETTTYSNVNTPIKVAKWQKPVVSISIESQPTELESKVLNDFITKFNKNSISTKLERVANSGDIKIYFQADTSGSAGRSGPSTGADYVIDSAEVKLDERVGVFEQSLASILSHELFHALGFMGHYDGTVCRLMSSKTCGSRFTINEERLIQMLYSTEIPVESSEPEIRSYFQNWNPK